MSKEGDDIFRMWEETDPPDLADTFQALGKRAELELSKQKPPMEGGREAQLIYQEGQDAIMTRFKLTTDALIGEHVVFQKLEEAIHTLRLHGHMTPLVEEALYDVAAAGIESVGRMSLHGGKYVGQMIQGDVPPHPAWATNFEESKALRRFKEQRRQQPPSPPSQGGK